MKIKIGIIVTLVIFCMVPLSMRPLHAEDSLLMKVGWKMQVVQQIDYYPNPDSFLETYFGTPPYPAVLDIMVPIDRLWKCEDWIVAVSHGAQNYPHAEIHLYTYFDLANEAQWTAFGIFLNRLQDTAVTYTGLDGEHVTYGAAWPNNAISHLWQTGAISNTQLINLFDRAAGVVTARGIAFLCYYLVFGDASFRGRYLKMAHIPWPNNMRESGLDLNNTPDFLGMKPGAIVNQQFPGNPPPDDPNQIVQYGECDWTHEAVRRVFIHTVAGERGYTIFGSGIAMSSFTGVSGVQTPHLWDNPLLRQWVWSEIATYPLGTFRTSKSEAISVAGVVSGASYAQNSLSPGSIISLFGENLASTVASSAALPLPITLGGVTVSVNNILCPLYYVSPNQINLQLPYALAGESMVSMIVERNGAASEPVVFEIGSVNPAFFTTNMQGSGDGCVLHNTDDTLVTPSHPAVPGEYVQLFCTGLGEVTPQVASGEVAMSDPLSWCVTTPTVMVGGIAATVVFAGLAPGFVGVYLVNIQIPEGSPVGDAVALILTVDGVESNVVTLAIVAS
jgi:uncharacterized protein (TIGR03437 family)